MTRRRAILCTRLQRSSERAEACALSLDGGACVRTYVRARAAPWYHWRGMSHEGNTRLTFAHRPRRCKQCSLAKVTTRVATPRVSRLPPRGCVSRGLHVYRAKTIPLVKLNFILRIFGSWNNPNSKRRVFSSLRAKKSFSYQDNSGSFVN